MNKSYKIVFGLMLVIVLFMGVTIWNTPTIKDDKTAVEKSYDAYRSIAGMLSPVEPNSLVNIVPDPNNVKQSVALVKTSNGNTIVVWQTGNPDEPYGKNFIKETNHVSYYEKYL
jgi:hypothetical protein